MVHEPAILRLLVNSRQPSCSIEMQSMDLFQWHLKSALNLIHNVQWLWIFVGNEISVDQELNMIWTNLAQESLSYSFYTSLTTWPAVNSVYALIYRHMQSCELAQWIVKINVQITNYFQEAGPRRSIYDVDDGHGNNKSKYNVQRVLS